MDAVYGVFSYQSMGPSPTRVARKSHRAGLIGSRADLRPGPLQSRSGRDDCELAAAPHRFKPGHGCAIPSELGVRRGQQRTQAGARAAKAAFHGADLDAELAGDFVIAP